MASVSPRKIAVIWELGGGMGHAARLAPIIQALVAAGHDLNVVARAPRRIYEALDDGIRDSAALTYYRAPALPPRTAARGGARPVCATLADILIEDGFAEPVGLAAYLGEWRRLLGSLSPALVISDFSPFANLVVADMAPILVVGSGYAIPPAGGASFLDRPPPHRSVANHDRLLMAVATAVRKVGVTAPESIGHAFRGSVNFPLAFPILDPYRGRRPEQALTPYTLPDLAKVEHQQASVPDNKAFVYLPASHAGLRAVVDALVAEGCPAIVYGPGAGTTDLPAAATIRLLDRPADMATILPQVQMVIHSGGLGLAHVGLVARRPQLVLPTCVEQQLTANALVGQGVARAIRRREFVHASAIRCALQQCLHDPALAHRATQLAESYPTDGRASLDQILTSAAALLN